MGLRQDRCVWCIWRDSLRMSDWYCRLCSRETSCLRQELQQGISICWHFWHRHLEYQHRQQCHVPTSWTLRQTYSDGSKCNTAAVSSSSFAQYCWSIPQKLVTKSWAPSCDRRFLTSTERFIFKRLQPLLDLFYWWKTVINYLRWWNLLPARFFVADLCMLFVNPLVRSITMRNRAIFSSIYQLCFLYKLKVIRTAAHCAISNLISCKSFQ